MIHGSSGSSNGYHKAGQQRAGRRRRGRSGAGGGFRAPDRGQQFQERNPVPPCTEYDKAYFQAYSDIGIHEEMIKDHVRTSTYRAAIMRYQDSIAGKVVMDVGCGTGILAIFCALAGARRVYAVDASDIAVQCSFEEPCVETISGENVMTWPSAVMHVDCYAVLTEELESITAKYKFMSMLQAPLHGFAFWFDVEFDGPQNVPSNEHLHTVEASSEMILHPNNKSKKRAKSNEAIVLSTAPEDDPTHWQQTIIYFYEPIEVKQDQIIQGSINLSQSKENARFLNIRLEYSSGGRSFVKETVMR